MHAPSPAGTGSAAPDPAGIVAVACDPALLARAAAAAEALGATLAAGDWTDPAPDGLALVIDLDRHGADRALRALRARPPTERAAVLALSADPALREAALAGGADDVAAWPGPPLYTDLRVRRFLEGALATTRGGGRLADAQIERMRAELEAVQEEIIVRLTRAGAYRDRETADHILRMARYCEIIAGELGLSPEASRFLYLAAQMHDIGKMGVPDAILRKPGPLDADERAVMDGHTAIGAEILEGSAFPLIQAAETIAATHHERWDGTGYPRGLAGEAIPLAGRIAAVADVFDALTSQRAYKASWSLDEARDALLAERGRHFDPACVDALMRRFDEVRRIAEGGEASPAPAPR